MKNQKLSLNQIKQNDAQLKKWQLLLKETPTDKIFCLKIPKENFYKIKTIGNFDFDLEYMTGDKSSLII